MKIIRLLFMIAVACMLSCCSKKEEKLRANAIGVFLYEYKQGDDYSLNTTTFLTRNCDLWVNDYAIKCVFDSKEIGNPQVADPKYLTNNYPYYPFTMERLIGLFYDRTNGYVNEDNFQELCPQIAEYAKTHMNTYNYVAMVNGNCLLFNRISNENY